MGVGYGLMSYITLILVSVINIQLLVGRHNFHDIFFKLPPSKQMLYLSATGPPDPTRPSGPTHDRTAGLKVGSISCKLLFEYLAMSGGGHPKFMLNC